MSDVPTPVKGPPRMSLVKAFLVTAVVGCAVAASVALAATINGTPGNDTIIGTTNPDTINSQAGNDTVLGLAGADTINSGTGNDTVYGDGSCPPGTTDPSYCSLSEGKQDGNDTIQSGDGNDTVLGMG